MATGIAIATGHFALGSALLIGGSSLDMVDGELARKKKLSTPGGAFFDSTMDRVCDGFIFGGCVIYYAGTAMMQVSLVVLITSFVVSYTRARAEALGLYGAEGLAQRADRIVMLGIAMAFSPLVAHGTEGFVPHPHYWVTAGIICVLAVLNTATAVSRIRWTMRQLSHVPAPQALPIRAPAREAPMDRERCLRPTGPQHCSDAATASYARRGAEVALRLAFVAADRPELARPEAFVGTTSGSSFVACDRCSSWP